MCTHIRLASVQEQRTCVEPQQDESPKSAEGGLTNANKVRKILDSLTHL